MTVKADRPIRKDTDSIEEKFDKKSLETAIECHLLSEGSGVEDLTEDIRNRVDLTLEMRRNLKMVEKAELLQKKLDSLVPELKHQVEVSFMNLGVLKRLNLLNFKRTLEIDEIYSEMKELMKNIDDLLINKI